MTIMNGRRAPPVGGSVTLIVSSTVPWLSLVVYVVALYPTLMTTDKRPFQILTKSSQLLLATGDFSSILRSRS